MISDAFFALRFRSKIIAITRINLTIDLNSSVENTKLRRQNLLDCLEHFMGIRLAFLEEVNAKCGTVRRNGPNVEITNTRDTFNRAETAKNFVEFNGRWGSLH